MHLMRASFSLPVIALLAGLLEAVTLRSSDAVDHIVDTSAATAHCGLLNNLVAGPGQFNSTVPLPTNIANAELKTIVEFIDSFPVHVDVRTPDMVIIVR